MRRPYPLWRSEMQLAPREGLMRAVQGPLCSSLISILILFDIFYKYFSIKRMHSAREVTPHRRNMLFSLYFTVFSDKNSSLAMSA